MKLFKVLIFLIIVIAGTSYLYLQFSPKPQFQPLSEKNTFQTNLNYSLNLAHLTPLQTQYRDYLSQVEFIINHDSSSTSVIFSTKKNPIWQVASLQNIFKAAKMEDRRISLIDLSIDHPYVTFKNN